MKPPRAPWSLAAHEAGHAVVAAALGSLPHTAEAGRDSGRVRFTQDKVGGAAADPPPLPAARGNSLAIGFALQQSAIAMAGAIAAALLALRAPGLRARAACAKMSSVDADMVEEASAALEASGACPERGTKISADVATDILVRHWGTTMTVASALRRSGELGPDRLASLLAPVAADPEPLRRLLAAAEELAGGEHAPP